jgi:hypothetical protein
MPVRSFEAVVRACMDAGFVNGEGFAVDAERYGGPAPSCRTCRRSPPGPLRDIRPLPCMPRSPRTCLQWISPPRGAHSINRSTSRLYVRLRGVTTTADDGRCGKSTAAICRRRVSRSGRGIAKCRHCSSSQRLPTDRKSVDALPI